jgi:hypothetical protein
MNEKKILFVNQSSGYLMIDIVNAYAISGKYKELVLASGEIRPMGINLAENVKVRKIKKYNRSSVWKRTWSWVLGSIQVMGLIWFKYRKHELFLVSNPPTISFVTFFCKNKYSFLIYDVYPDGLVTGGFINKNSYLYKFWAYFNIRCYKHAINVFTISNGMKERLSKYVESNKITVVPAWANSFVKRRKKIKNNPFAINNKLDNTFNIIYSGNVGKGHDLETMLKLADIFKSENDIRFVIIGEGWGKEALQSHAVTKELHNMLFLPFQPVDHLSYSLSSADIAFVSVAKEAASVCVPSKVYNLIKLNVPILGIAQKNSELSRLINENALGACFEKEQLSECISFIQKIKTNKVYKKDIENNITRYSAENTVDIQKSFMI